MKTLNRLIQTNLRQYGMIVALLFIVILFQILTSGVLLNPLNVTNLILQNSYILVLAIGMVMVIITGHIDLSVGSVAAFIGAMAAILMVQFNLHPLLAGILCLLLGALIGAWQGFWVAYIRIPAFIVTLAGMLLFRGLTMIALQGQSIAPFPDAFKQISSGFIPDFADGGNFHLLSLITGLGLSLLFVYTEVKNRKKEQSYDFTVSPTPFFITKVIGMVVIVTLFSYLLATYKGIPNILLLMLVLIVGYSFMMKKTVIGRHIYAVGGNEKAAELSGIKTKRVTFWVFVNMGVLSALSGLIFAARLNAATPKAGNLFELDAIAAAFIGGASAYGGIGTVVGAIIGGLVMGVMNNGMSIIGLGVDWQQAIKGLVLLCAVAFDIFTKNRSISWIRFGKLRRKQQESRSVQS